MDGDEKEEIGGKKFVWWKPAEVSSSSSKKSSSSSSSSKKKGGMSYTQGYTKIGRRRRLEKIKEKEKLKESVL